MQIEGRRFLVTGGAGNIGSHVTDELIRRGAVEVVVIDSLDRGREENLAWALANGSVRLVVDDIRNVDVVNRLMEGIDGVFHQAAFRITQCAAQPRDSIEVMVTGSYNVFQAAVDAGAKKIVAASTASVYGEPSYLPMDEKHPFNNDTLYGACKIADEQILRALHAMHGIDYVALRYFNVYGPRMDAFGRYTEVMIRWLERIQAGEPPLIFGDGTDAMDFVYVGDIARANILAMESDVTDEAINVATGEMTSLSELCEIMLRMAECNLKPEFRPKRKINPVSTRKAGTKKAAELLGFEPTVSLPEGLKLLHDWYQTLPIADKDAVG